MERQDHAVIFNIMRFCLHDGPGIRTTVFFKGCPLRCAWCHNPESQSAVPEVLYFPERCRLCDACLRACPQDALRRVNGTVTVAGLCRRCGTCAEACPSDARQLAGRRITVAEALAEIARDRVFFEESGGGVTFSGGEPLAQPRFVEALAGACRERGIHTALETCGFAARDTLLRLGRAVDLVLFDLKLVDSDKHRQYTGVPSEPILRNLAALAAAGCRAIVRVPVVPGINDSAGDWEALSEFLTPVGLRQIHLLPYHRAGTEKYRRLGMTYTLPALAAPSPDHMRDIAARLQREGFHVNVGGSS
jgi:pyruvate formate lyase activating enzyme